jgi:hypothetical protein
LTMKNGVGIVGFTHRDRLRDRPFEAGATCRIKPATVPTPAGRYGADR